MLDSLLAPPPPAVDDNCTWIVYLIVSPSGNTRQRDFSFLLGELNALRKTPTHFFFFFFVVLKHSGLHNFPGPISNSFSDFFLPINRVLPEFQNHIPRVFSLWTKSSRAPSRNRGFFFVPVIRAPLFPQRNLAVDGALFPPPKIFLHPAHSARTTTLLVSFALRNVRVWQRKLCFFELDFDFFFEGLAKR